MAGRGPRLISIGLISLITFILLIIYWTCWLDEQEEHNGSLLLVDLTSSVSGNEKEPQQPQQSNNHRGTNIIPIQIYYETLCPDSRYFFLKQLEPALKVLGKYLTVEFVPYGKAETLHPATTTQEPTFTCQHGPAECEGNIIHACAIHYIQSPPRLFPYLSCMIENARDPWRAGLKCATAAAEEGIDWTRIESCARGREGAELLVKYGSQTKGLRPRISFIPTVVVSGSQSGQTSILKNFLTFLCTKLVVSEC